MTAYEQIQQRLADIGSEVSAAEAHGMLCGLLCTKGESLLGDWFSLVLLQDQDLDESSKSAGPGDAGVSETQLPAALLALYNDTLEGLEDSNLGFSLLLPDDDEPLSLRAEALADWSEGFLLGASTGGLQNLKALPPDVGEIIGDLVHISRGAHEDEEESNQDEGAYAELVEYVRVGALLLYEELNAMQASPPPPTLH